MTPRTAGKYHITGSILLKNETEKLFFFDDAQFALSRDVHSQSKKCWCDKTLHVIHDNSFVSPWIAVSACKFLVPLFSNKQILTPLFRELTEEKIYDNVYSFQELKQSNRVENTGVSR